MSLPISLQQRWRDHRFNSFNRVLRDQFEARVYKIGLRSDFTCPNRDGKVAVGGCIYCNNASHTPESYRPRVSVTAQLEQGAQAIAKRHKAERFIAYFQSYSNTYDSLTKLERLYREALDFPGVVGIAIATRPDCLADDVLELLSELAEQTYLWLEIGLESMYDRTLNWVNRGHGVSEYIDAVERAKARRLRVCTHLVLGFPGESRDEMLATPALLNRLGIDGIKLHNLHVIKNTPLEKYYRQSQVPLFSRDQYVGLVIDFLELLDPNIVVHRLSGQTYRAITVAPHWSIDKLGVHNAIFKAMEERDAWQGRLFSRGQATKPLQTGFTCSQGAAP